MSDALRFEPALRAKYGSQYRKARGKNGLEFKICCPFCLKNVGKLDKKFKLYMNPGKGVYRCYRCPAKGQLSDLFGNIAWSERNVFAAPKTVQVNDVSLPGELVGLNHLPDDHIALRYLHARKFDPMVLDQQYGIRYCYEGQKFIGGLFDTTNTLVFPIWMGGRLAGWQARLLYNPNDLTDEDCIAMGFPVDEDGTPLRPPKYFTPPSVAKGQVLYNYDMARHSDIVVVSEGPFDALSIGPAGVATLGKGISEDQARMLKAYWKLVVIMLDPGDADAEMNELYSSICLSVQALRVTLDGYSDPGETPTKEIWRQIDQAAQKEGIRLEDYNWGPYWNNNVIKE